MAKHDLNRQQIGAQLKNWKDRKYNHAGKAYEKTSEELKSLVLKHAPDHAISFAASVITEMIGSTKPDEDQSRDHLFITKFCRQRKNGTSVLKLLLNGDLGFISFFGNIVDEYTSLATKCFPSLVKMVCGAESNFSIARLRMVREEWQTEFLQLVYSNRCQAIILDAEGDCKGFNKWNLVLCEVEDNLFRKWALYNYSSSLPLIEFPPKETVVHKQSRAILYYTAGWILSCAGKANKAGKGLMIEFSMRHSLKASEAIAEGLPTSVVD